MKRFTRLIPALALGLGGMAHAQEAGASAQEADAYAQELEAPETTLAPGLYAGRFLHPIKLRDCWYFISAEVIGPGAPSALTLRRLPTNHCEAATRVLALSYDSGGGALLAATRGDELVVGYWVRMWPSPLQGAIRLFHVSTDTLENVRTSHNELLATGGISAVRMDFEGQNLVVQGARSGTLAGETGTGGYYTATFERFLDSDTPPVVVAQQEAPAAESDVLTDGQYFPPGAGRYRLPFKVKDCWYFATATTTSRRWSLYQLALSRLAVNGCEGQTVKFDLSYDPRTFLVTTKGESAIAIAWSVRGVPEFIPFPFPTTLRLYNISPDTLENLRTVNSQLSSSTNGKVYATSLDFEGHRLVVQGTKEGVLLGGSPESGSGPNYTATFEHFLDSDAPASVIAD